MTGTLIVGGGVAGATAAAALARVGERVTLAERTSGPHHKVCGEFLSWEAVRGLAAIGFDARALGGAPINRLRLVAGKRAAEAALPGTAIGVSRHRLDEALLAHAAASGARVLRGVRVRAVSGDDDSAAVVVDGHALDAGRIVVATGKHDLRGARRRLSPGSVNGLVGLKMHYALASRADTELAGVVELHLFDGGYAGLQRIEDGRANLCLLTDGRRLSSGDHDWPAVIARIAVAAPRLGERLAGARALFSRPLGIAGIPYGHIEPQDGGVERIGDQLAVIHSFTGDGMAIAVESGRLLARLRGAAHRARMRARARRPVLLSSLLYAGFSRPLAGRAAVAMSALAPGLLTAAAQLTRLPD